MPVYEYECLSCRVTTEAMQKFSDAPLTTCRECGGQLRKLISNTSFVLKGTGWYKTDYAAKGGGSEEKPAASKDTKTASDSKTESKTAKEAASETKPETKKEPAPSS